MNSEKFAPNDENFRGVRLRSFASDLFVYFRNVNVFVDRESQLPPIEGTI